jgi:hypothetical protein
VRKLFVICAAALVLPGAASGAACSPFNCAPSQFTLANGTMLGYRLQADKPVTIVDLRTGEARFTLPGGLTAGNVLVHQDGTQLQWYDMTTGEQTATADGVDGDLGAVSQDGSHAVTINLRGVWVVSPESTRFVALPAGRWEVDALSGDNLFLIRYLGNTGGYQIRLLHVASGKLEAKPLKDPHESGTIWGMPYSRLSSPDGRYLFTLYVAGNGAAMVHALNLETAKARCIDLPGTGDYLSATSWAMVLRGNTLWAVSPGYNRVVAIDVRARKIVRHFALSLPYWNRGFGTRAALSPDGSRVALADGESVAVLSLGQRKVVSRTTKKANALGYSPTGRLWTLS